ncbi:MAG: helix-turn-helix domain-containing protein [Deltaproteobacteria bacterium]
MITLLITEDEKRIRELLSQVLAKEGFSVSGDPSRISIQKENHPDGTIEQKIVEFHDELMAGKGELYRSMVERIERALIEHVLEKTEGNQLKASRLLGINRNTLRAKIKKLCIDVKKWKAQ